MGNFWQKVDKDEFLVPAILTVIIIAVGVIAPVAFGKIIDVLFNIVTNYLGWFYDLGIFMSFITQNESMVYTMAGMTAKDRTEDEETGEQKSPVILKIFWGAAIALMGYILLLSGGLESVQHSVLVLGIPVLIILLINAASFIKATTNRLEYDLTLTEEQKKILIEEKEREF